MTKERKAKEDDYIEFGGKDLTITREDYEHGYNVKLKIERR